MNDTSFGTARTTDPYLRKRRRRRLLIGSAVILGVAACAVGASFGVSAIASARSSPKVSQEDVLGLWAAKDYLAVAQACEVSLSVDPLDPFYLLFDGFASFYLGLAETDGELRGARMDDAIFSIRKALIAPDTPLRPEASYVLGKAYYHKGVDYYNEAIDYLNESASLGYYQSDTWEYLALAARGAGRLAESLAYFDKAVELKPDSPELSLAAASAFVDAGDAAKGERLAAAALESTTDDFLAERSRFLLADIYRKSGRPDDALAQYEAIKALNGESADAWFYEGLVYSEAGDPIKARAAWRKAVNIDPMHAAARQKLSERS
ncbi:MAG TPA: tetratricopeptide repeat protein [Spirochaetia bacterium]|nr:tetratricopeptide repeat protein [Spirochaetaceae bacterium]HPE87895.1 tetratricopeptide repeat protein [Spirochaetales bacterium]HRW23308.1 tetratricopeptide repeat protein [Spirochaetia bacterium]